MTVIGFDSFDDMQEYLRKAAEQAHQGLHPAQQALTFGDHWVQFHDVANRWLIFGRVHTLDEVRDAEIASGANTVEARLVVESTAQDIEAGFLYGTAYDRYNVAGELGTTHKAHAWPIDAETFEAARQVGWQMDEMELGFKVSLNHAFILWRDHVRGQR